MEETQRREFQATEGLLHDVMRKQAGSVEKAVLEAVMNSVDAGASEITVDLHEEGLVVTDDGKGMSREEVEEYFEKFGLKDSDIEDKEFGKFRMGRGQIFNFGKNIWHSKDNIMVVDLNRDKTTVVIGDEEHKLDSSGLSYNLLESENQTEGCTIEVEFYDPLNSLSDTVTEIKKLVKYIPWLHDVDLKVNGEEVYNELDPDHESHLAYYVIDQDTFGRRTSIYNKGAFVKEEPITKSPSIVVTKEDMDVNFARTDILDTCDIWKQVRKELIEVTREVLSTRSDLNLAERKWLIGQAAESQQFLDEIRNRPLIEDVTGDKWSIDQLLDEKVTFTTRDNKLAENVKDRHGVIPIRNTFENALSGLVEEENALTFDELVEEKMWEVREFDEDELSTRRSERLDQIRWFLDQVGYDGEVRSGFSHQQDVWKNQEGVLFVDKNFLNHNKDELFTQGLIDILEIAAHDGSTLEEVTHGYSFKGDFWKYAKNMGEYQNKLLNGNVNV